MKHRLILFTAALTVWGCASEGADKLAIDANNSNNVNNVNNTNGSNQNNRNNVVVPENEFEFARPATVGTRLFVANATLNTVAVVDAVSLQIETVPVGFKPTLVVGPTTASVEGTRVFVLNEGSSTVSVIEPESLAVDGFRVMRHVNSLATNPTATVAVTWFDSQTADVVPPDADISAVNVVTKDFEAQIAVGFNVRDVRFSDDGAYVLIVSDDGVSRLEVDAIVGDTFAPPVPIGGPGFAEPDNVDILVDPTGRYVISRIFGFDGLVMLDMETGEGRIVQLGSNPTDVDWVGGANPSVLVMLPAESQFLVADVPSGLLNLEGYFQTPTMPDPDMGVSDMGMSDMGANDMAGNMDMGSDMDMAADVGGLDDMGGMDMGPVDPPTDIDGVTFVALPVPDLSASQISPDGQNALLFDGRGQVPEAVIIDALGGTNTIRPLLFEKPIFAAKSDPAGETFVVIHTKEPGSIPVGVGPSDPEYVARSWAITLLDVKSTFQQLVLTEFEPNELSIYNDEMRRVLYVTFKGTLGNRTLLVANLGTFSTSSFVVASPTDGLGPVEGQGLIYVSQDHPQGRISFVDVETQKRRTITGYELNAGID